MKKSLVIIFAFLLFSGLFWLVFANKPGGFIPDIIPRVSQEPVLSENKPILTPKQSNSTKNAVLLNVPFVAQAPLGNWSDPHQQDGCEEAASYMAMLWVRHQSAPSSQQEEKELLAIDDFEQTNYGSFHDTSAKDTADRIFKGYFHYENVSTRYDITTDDIKNELSKGNLVIVPADGQRLGNPYYTQPGPERHNLVIRGYNPKTKEFITNDNGTKHGEGYLYKEEVLFNAIRDYPTGDHLLITNERKAMIIVNPL